MEAKTANFFGFVGKMSVTDLLREWRIEFEKKWLVMELAVEEATVPRLRPSIVEEPKKKVSDYESEKHRELRILKLKQNSAFYVRVRAETQAI